MTNWKDALIHTNNELKIRLHVIPNSNNSIFPAGYNTWRNSIEIKVKAEPKEKKANREVIYQIAKYFNVSPKNISIISGEKGRNKILIIKKLKFEKLYSKIKRSLNGV